MNNRMTLVSFQQVCINKVGENLRISEYEEPWTDRVAYASRRVKLEAQHVRKFSKLIIDKNQKVSKEHSARYDFPSHPHDLFSPIRPQHRQFSEYPQNAFQSKLGTVQGLVCFPVGTIALVLGYFTLCGKNKHQ